MATSDSVKKIYKKMKLFIDSLEKIEEALMKSGEDADVVLVEIGKRVGILTALRDQLFDSYHLDDLMWYVETAMTSDDLIPALDDLSNDTPVSSATNRGSNGRALLGFTSQEMFDVMDALGLPPNTPPSRVKESLLERLKP